MWSSWQERKRASSIRNLPLPILVLSTEVFFNNEITACEFQLRAPGTTRPWASGSPGSGRRAGRCRPPGRRTGPGSQGSRREDLKKKEKSPWNLEETDPFFFQKSTNITHKTTRRDF